jgi:hypothetical protein
MDKESVNYVVKGAKVKWAKVYEPDGTFPPARWSVNVYPSEVDKAALLKLGIQFRTDDKDGGQFFVAKRNVETNAGKKMDPPRVVDAAKRPFTEPIGNGSTCNVIVNVYPWTFGKKTGMGAWLEAVQVVEHIPYASTERVDFDEVPGASTSNTGADDLPF